MKTEKSEQQKKELEQFVNENKDKLEKSGTYGGYEDMGNQPQNSNVENFIPEGIELEFPEIRNYTTRYRSSQFAEKPYGTTMTIPDETLSVREVLKRYARGLPIHSTAIPVYDGPDIEFKDLSKMDLADREQYLEDLQKELAETQERLRNAKDQENKARIEADQKKQQEFKEALKAEILNAQKEKKPTE